MKVIFLRSNSVMPDPRVEKEVDTLIKKDYDVEIIAWNRENKNRSIECGIKEINNKKVKITWFNINATFGGGIRENLLPLLKFQIKTLIWLIKNRKTYDIIHACDFDTVIPAWVVSKFLRKKYVYDIFDYYVDAFRVPNKLKNIIEKVDIKMINDSNGTIITNESRKEQIKKSKPKILEVIHNSPSMYKVNIDNNNFSIKNDKIKIVYVGILGKGRFLKEMIEVVKTNRNLELHIGGFGQLEEYIKKMSEKNKNIFFYGKLHYKDTIKLESECDIMFAIYDPKVPNHKYSSPNKLYEAMMLKKPIIVCEDTGIDKLVKNSQIGYVTKYSYEELKIVMEKIVKDRIMWKSMGERANQLFINDYSWEIMSDRLYKLYLKL